MVAGESWWCQHSFTYSNTPNDINIQVNGILSCNKKLKKSSKHVFISFQMCLTNIISFNNPEIEEQRSISITCTCPVYVCMIVQHSLNLTTNGSHHVLSLFSCLGTQQLLTYINWKWYSMEIWRTYNYTQSTGQHNSTIFQT